MKPTPTDFTPMMASILRTCERFGYTLDAWRSLPERDKHTLLAWDIRRQKQRKELHDALIDKEKLTPEALTLIALSS